MAAKIKVDQLESVDGSTNLILNNSVTMASGKTLPAASLTGTIAVARIADGSITAAKLAADTATQAELDAVNTTATAALPKAGGTMTGDLVLNEITETEATSAATSYTIDLANGTIFDLTSSSTCTVTIPAVEAGKSFTVIAKVPAAWSGTIKWSGGAAPTTGSGITIYSFVSDGSSWYGMQAGTGFA